MRGVKRFAAYAWFVLAFNVGVILWGAYVRATGSGAGCGEHWPLCNGVVVPRSPQTATIIEFTHRITSGLALVFVLGLVFYAFRVFAARHPVRRFAGLAVLFTFTEALIGAALVLLGHVGTNTSTARGYSLTIHLINTLTLLAMLALAAWYASCDAAGRERAGGTQGERRWPVFAMAGFIALGVSGAIAALGDTLFASSSLAEGWRQDFSASAHIFVRLRVWHPVLAGVFGCLFIGLAIRILLASRTTDAARKLGIALIVLTMAQGLLGVLNLVLLAPVWMQMVHLLGADLLWLTLVLFSAEVMLPSRPLGAMCAAVRDHGSGTHICDTRARGASRVR